MRGGRHLAHRCFDMMASPFNPPAMTRRMSMRSAALLALAVFSVSSSVAQTSPSSAVKQDAWSVRGLQASAEIVLDQWGVPHIFAGSARDAFFLQGYNAARDRL